MTRDQAMAVAESARASFGVPAEFALKAADKRIVELVEGETKVVADLPPEPGPRYDLVAWVVSFAGPAAFVQLTIDDATGRVVRIRRSG